MAYYFDCSNLLCLYGYQQAAGFRCPLTKRRAYFRTKRRLMLIYERCESWKCKEFVNEKNTLIIQWEKAKDAIKLFSNNSISIFKNIKVLLRGQGCLFSFNVFVTSLKCVFLVSILVYFVMLSLQSVRSWKSNTEIKNKTGLDVAKCFYSDPR